MENCCITASGDCLHREVLCLNGTRILVWQAQYPTGFEKSDVCMGFLDDFRTVCREGLYNVAVEVYQADKSPRKRYRFCPFDCRFTVIGEMLSICICFTENGILHKLSRDFCIKVFEEGSHLG